MVNMQQRTPEQIEQDQQTTYTHLRMLGSMFMCLLLAGGGMALIFVAILCLTFTNDALPSFEDYTGVRITLALLLTALGLISFLAYYGYMDGELPLESELPPKKRKPRK